MTTNNQIAGSVLPAIFASIISSGTLAGNAHKKSCAYMIN